MKKPPRCPHCKERIIKVLEYDHVIYVFDPVSGTYKADDGDLEINCYYCDAKLYDAFPDGVCNYGK
jgi:DNA-directed RNA polymerase subunit RPC12/RpoP